MSVAIMQPYFFPYIGYFQLIEKVDNFVFYDDVSFIKKGWINRNQILLNGEPFLFTIPLIKQSQNKEIREIEVLWGKEFPQKFLSQLSSAYKKAPYYSEFLPYIEELFSNKAESISDLAIQSIQIVYHFLGLEQNWSRSSQTGISKDFERSDRLIEITKSLGSTNYINPINGQNLYDKAYFKEKEIDLSFLLPNISSYPQVQTKRFVPNLSILDLLFNLEKELIIEKIHLGDLT